jgi:hypothetical protein
MTHGVNEDVRGVGHLAVVDEVDEDDVRLLDGVEGSDPLWTFIRGDSRGFKE